MNSVLRARPTLSEWGGPKVVESFGLGATPKVNVSWIEIHNNSVKKKIWKITYFATGFFEGL